MWWPRCWMSSSFRPFPWPSQFASYARGSPSGTVGSRHHNEIDIAICLYMWALVLKCGQESWCWAQNMTSILTINPEMWSRVLMLVPKPEFCSGSENLQVWSRVLTWRAKFSDLAESCFSPTSRILRKWLHLYKFPNSLNIKISQFVENREFCMFLPMNAV